MKAIRPRTKAIWRIPLSLLVLTMMLHALPALAAQCPQNAFPGVNPAALTDPQAMYAVMYTKPILDGNYLKKYVTPLPNPLAPAWITPIPASAARCKALSRSSTAKPRCWAP